MDRSSYDSEMAIVLSGIDKMECNVVKKRFLWQLHNFFKTPVIVLNSDKDIQ